MLIGRRLVWISGITLIGVGIVCLYLSGAVVTGWWQGTLDAFGVGFIVGGVVDVLALTGLNQIIAAEDQQRRKYNRQAEAILEGEQDTRARAEQARDLLLGSGRWIDARLRKQLLDLVNAQWPPPSWSPWPRGGTDDGGTPWASER